MSRASFRALLFWVIRQGNAISTESLQARNPSDNNTQAFEPKWVSGPKTRGTFSLIFACVLTLFACAYTTVHVNFSPLENECHTLARFIPIWSLRKNKTLSRFLAKQWLRRLGWACINLLFPEGVLAIAAYERKIASLLRDEVNKIIGGRPHVEKWDMFLAFYAIMGGFVIPNNDNDAVSVQLKGKADSVGETGTTLDNNSEITSGVGTTEAPMKSPEPTLEQDDAIKAINGDEEKQTGRVEGLEDNLENINRPLTLTPYGVLQLAKWQWGPPPPQGSSPVEAIGNNSNLITITPSQMQEKNTANLLAKALVAWQALWIIVQVIGRRAQSPRLPVTLLELHTCLNAFCAFPMYMIWWYKPINIDIPMMVRLRPEQIIFLRKGELYPKDPTDPWSEAGDEEKAPHPNLSAVDTSRVFLTSRSGIGKLAYQRLIGHRDIQTEFFSAMSDAYIRLWRGRRVFWKEFLIISFIGLVFGGGHLAAWNSSFPTYTERILWQIAAAVTPTAWSGFVLSLWLSVFVVRRREGRVFSKVCGVFIGVGIFPILLLRMYLLAESFASIRRLPIGSYSTSNWSAVWPHVG